MKRPPTFLQLAGGPTIQAVRSCVVGLSTKEHFACNSCFLKKDDEYDARNNRIIQMVETAGIKAKTVRYLASGDDRAIHFYVTRLML